jgi:hypothetical protein
MYWDINQIYLYYLVVYKFLYIFKINYTSRYSKPAASLWDDDAGMNTHSCVYTQIYSCVCACTQVPPGLLTRPNKFLAPEFVTKFSPWIC